MNNGYLTDDEKKALLKLARDTIKARLYSEVEPSPPTVQGPLAQPGAAFVTLRSVGELRGCIGYTEAFQPLYQTVMSCALAAAFDDPRFPPLSEVEYPSISIEISVLTPLQLIEDPAAVEVGKHGLLIASRGGRGLLLPQVATDNNWDRETFLDYTCRKAGLPPDEWKSGQAEIYVFEAEVFAEEDFL